MGCVASKLEEEEEVVAICRERKRQLKLAVEKRYALAEAHCKYFHSLNAVAAAIKLFVARHSSPSSPYLITFPPPCPSSPSPSTQNVISNPMFLQQTPSETKHESIACNSCIASTTSDSSNEEQECEQEREEVENEGGRVEQNEYYYMQMPMPMHMHMPMPMPMPSPQRDFGWDFFYPFESVRTEVMNGYHRNLDDDLRAVREEEGIPELEEEVERGKVVSNVEENNEGVEHVVNGVETMKVGDVATENVVGEQRGLAVLDTPAEGRELLEALKDIEDHFIRAYDSGKDVTRMLEANRIPLHSNLDEIKGWSYLQFLSINFKSFMGLLFSNV